MAPASVRRDQRRKTGQGPSLAGQAAEHTLRQAIGIAGREDP
jgi:hypothetical protein